MTQATQSNLNYKGKVISPGTVLRGNYYHCNFYLANLSGVRLVGSFDGCCFTNAEFRYASMLGATFNYCNFIGINFKDGQLRGCTFNNCDFARATLKNIGGITTNTISMSCKGVLQMSTDFAIKMLGAKQIYALCPRDVKDMVTKPGEFSLKDFKPLKKAVDVITGGAQYTIGGVETASNRRVPRRYTTETRVGTPVELVDAAPLPTVEHYRSKPSKVTESQKNSTAQDDWDDEDYYYAGAGYGGMGCGGQGWEQYLVTSKYKFGYKDNAVLECSDIEEYTACLS